MTNTIIKEITSTTTDSMVLQYFVREPKVKSEKKKAIILLHGVGSNEQDLFSLAKQITQCLSFIDSPVLSYYISFKNILTFYSIAAFLGLLKPSFFAWLFLI